MNHEKLCSHTLHRIHTSSEYSKLEDGRGKHD